jgi:hypothetical protein
VKATGIVGFEGLAVVVMNGSVFCLILLCPAFLLGLFFDPEAGGTMFL